MMAAEEKKKVATGRKEVLPGVGVCVCARARACALAVKHDGPLRAAAANEMSS